MAAPSLIVTVLLLVVCVAVLTTQPSRAAETAQFSPSTPVVVGASGSQIYFLDPVTKNSLREPAQLPQSTYNVMGITIDPINATLYCLAVTPNFNASYLYSMQLDETSTPEMNGPVDLPNLSVSNTAGFRYSFAWSSSRQALYIGNYYLQPGYKLIPSNMTVVNEDIRKNYNPRRPFDSIGFLENETTGIQFMINFLAASAIFPPVVAIQTFEREQTASGAPVTSALPSSFVAFEQTTGYGLALNASGLSVWKNFPSDNSITSVTGYVENLTPWSMTAYIPQDGDPDVMYLWIAYGPQGNNDVRYTYNISSLDAEMTKAASVADSPSLKWVAYTPGLPAAPSSSPSSSPSRSPVPDPPPKAPGSTITCTVNTTTPTFYYRDTRSRYGGANVQLSEQTMTVYSAFKGANATLPFPSDWTFIRESFTNDKGVTVGNLSFSRINSEGATYAYTHASDQYKALGISIVMTTLFNPTADVKVGGTTSVSPEYPTPKETAKFGIQISGAGSARLFGNNTQSVLRWSVCYENNQALGVFDLDNPSTTTADGVAAYEFRRLQQNTPAIGTSLRLVVPTQCVADGKLVSVVSQNLTVDTTGSGSTVSFCVEWQFPYFESSLHYDPDLSVLAQPESGNDSGDGDDSSLAIEIAVPVAVGGALLIVCCVVIVGSIILAIIALRRRKYVSRKVSDVQNL
eukprot:TRINITY_DN7730_c0_g1_i2.p1 TRINITY_DN7730_c0_g1~~TRINITY_DN7730_c0_g1_i2.p1  ORF type:complete len:687 (-),score=88.43 TRINITY_DN7730_c0_g1_i2:36-2096(-)